MKFISNSGSERVLDVLRSSLREAGGIDLVTSTFSLFAFAEVIDELNHASSARIILPDASFDLSLFGGKADRAARNQLRSHWLASTCARWIRDKAEIRRVPGGIAQGVLVIRDSSGHPQVGLTGSLSFSTDGLGITPAGSLNVIQGTEHVEESDQIATWFDEQWSALEATAATGKKLVSDLEALASHSSPLSIYARTLNHLFAGGKDALDEEQVVKSATGIRDTATWKKLYSFQRDGVIAAIDKLNRYGGCIIADSVGLGKTFEALAVIKYHELRNDRILVLCPKRLRENWTIYAANDRRNILAGDRFNYDVLNHTDLSRYDGLSGDIDLANLNWGNYDLVVIDESHNFRNKRSPEKGSETRYDRLMRQVVREGVKTRVLMLSATPVNNRLADLRNQIAFVTEGDDMALAAEGIESIDATTRKAQRQFNLWLELPDHKRTAQQLVEMLGFDYFTLLDRLTIARSRKHVQKYYGTSETGKFPQRLPPTNVKAPIDSQDEFPSIESVNDEIRRLRLAAYAPLRYVLPHKQAAYDAKYSTEIRGGESVFHQTDRENSLINLMRVNVLKRMESSVASFRTTIQRQLEGIETILDRLDSHGKEVDELEIDEIDLDDPSAEPLLVGSRVKVLVTDVDIVRWRQDLLEDRERLKTLYDLAKEVAPPRDAKLSALREMIVEKCRHPINDGNNKVVVFTAYADTAEYLYTNLAVWAKENLDLESALVTGSRRNQTTLSGLRKRMGPILAAFAPRAKDRPADLADEGEIDLLIATDCISEGQNLQDCDWLINYDIHWNPVRIIQRFGRIDRIGSPNECIQLVNFWPNVELEEYINLEQRVSGRMVLLDISATGEENVIERPPGDPMNDLDYRRKQLVQMQDAVLDLEDISSGVTITDLTLTDFRIDLARCLNDSPEMLEGAPLGSFAVTTADDTAVPPGTIFCLRAEGEAAKTAAPPGYPLSPLYLVHVDTDGAVFLPYTQAKQILDHMKRLCLEQQNPNIDACTQFDKATCSGRTMQMVQRQLAAAVASIIGKSEERSVASLFSTGGTHAVQGEFAGADDFEVMTYLVILSQAQA